MSVDKVFPYREPSEELKIRYENVWKRSEPIPTPLCKAVIDRVFGILFLLASLPILGIFKLGFLIEGLFNNRAKGPMLYFYWSISGGIRFKKWKIRSFYWDEIALGARAVGDWSEFNVEWNKNEKPFFGKLAKKFYFDELPQLWSVVTGKVSLVGPRPLSVEHFEKDLAQGNPVRKLVKGGLLGFGHIRKGTPEMGDPAFDAQYASLLLSGSCSEVLRLDWFIIKAGVTLMIKGEGL